MPDPTRAVVVDDSVTNLVLMDDATEQQFRDLGFIEMLWPGGDLVDVTDLAPVPHIGWTFDGETFTAPPTEPETPDEPGPPEG